MKVKVILNIEEQIKKEKIESQKIFVLDTEKMSFDLFFNINTYYYEEKRYEIYDDIELYYIKQDKALNGREIRKALEEQDKLEYSDVWSQYLEEMEDFGYAIVEKEGEDKIEFDRIIEWFSKKDNKKKKPKKNPFSKRVNNLHKKKNKTDEGQGALGVYQ